MTFRRGRLGKITKEFAVPILKENLSVKLRCSNFLKTRCKVTFATVE